MSVIKRRMLEALGEYLTSIVAPEIAAGDVIIGAPGTERAICFPHIAIRAQGPFVFMPFEDDELWTTTTTQAVSVGTLAGKVEIVLGFTDQVQREVMEDRILHEFYKQAALDGSPRRGVLVVQMGDFEVNAVANLATVPVAYVLGEETWVEEMVFERKRYSNLVLDVDLPAVVIRSPVYDIDALVSAITGDLTSVDPTLDDQVSIDEDGDVAIYP